MSSMYRLKLALVINCVLILVMILVGVFSGNWNMLSFFSGSDLTKVLTISICWLIAPFFYRFFDG